MLAENGVDYAFDRKTPAPSGISGAGEAPSDLESIRTGMGDCRRCKLCEKRNTIVFGVGDPRARLMFIGEGPGADEDAQGIPFVGRAGRLLTDIITKGMGIRREDVYIANIVKCRPPENRNPEPDEVAACLPFLEAQIRAVAPEVIVTLGRVPLNSLLGYAGPMGKARGIWTDYQGIPLMPTFHPSYLLRNPAAKRDVWDDIQQVMARLGLKAPGRS
jgi:DNA polymerase